MQLTRHRSPITAHVRTAEPADHPGIRSVLRASFEPYARDIPTPVFDRYLADLLDLDRHAANGHLMVAEDEGRIVGCGAFYPDTSLIGFDWPAGWASGRALAARPESRGRGVARALLAECERLSRAVGAPVFAFHTADFMSSAVELYRHLGYERSPEYDIDLAIHYGIDGLAPIPVIAYRRELSPVPAHVTEGAPR